MNQYYDTTHYYTTTHSDIWLCDDLGELRRMAEHQTADITRLHRDNTQLKQQVAHLTEQNNRSITQQISARFSARFSARSTDSR